MSKKQTVLKDFWPSEHFWRGLRNGLRIYGLIALPFFLLIVADAVWRLLK